MFDQLKKACQQADTWPQNLVGKQQLARVLRTYQNRLHEDKERLFVSDGAHVLFYETVAGQDNFKKTPLDGLEELTRHLDQHLQQRRKDPLSRHVFISAAHSRAALNCTPQMFKYICSYQQVSPIFVDMLASFGKQYRKADFHSASFSQDNLSKLVVGAETKIPEIGRSDWQLRHCYKLHGVEVSDFDQKWTMRQTAVYHSFDMEEGRAFWLTIKGNDEITERFVDGTQSLDSLRASGVDSLASSFIACLITHLITVDWCVDGWNRYIGTIEADIRELIVQVKGTPITPLTDAPEFTPSLLKSLSMKTTKGSQHPAPSRQNTGQTLSSFTERMKEAFNKPKKTEADIVPPQCPGSDQEGEEEMARIQERLRQFSMKESQRLTSTTTTLQEVKLAMTLNVRILRGLREYYEELFASSQFPQEIVHECERRGAFEDFIRRIKGVESHLEAECLRAEALALVIEDGKRQYESILQLYNMEISKLFALSGRESSRRMESSAKRMEIVAKQTARDSASMHVITFLTMVFLPGTFLGTIFSTPVFNNSDQSYTINPSILILFFEICGPMMLVTLIGWFWYMRWFKKSILGHRLEEGEGEDMV